MDLHNLKPAKGTQDNKKRLGRGTGSGKGKTSGKGHKGQKARSGKPLRPTFEGGQTPFFKRFPKRGFSNAPFKIEYAIINVSSLNRFEEGSEVSAKKLMNHNLISDLKDGLKVLGDGELNKALTIKANKFSKSAVKKIEAAGGKAEVI